jgi:peptide/nickel transport system substrate-binding protein
MRDFFTTLSAYDGRTGPPFTINFAYMSWTDYLNCFMNFTLPLFGIGWIADFADADNFVRPYMHSSGTFPPYQSYTADNGWGATKDALIDLALVTPDGANRQALYEQLALTYYNDCPSFPLPAPLGRFWCQYWVKGWHSNAFEACGFDILALGETWYPGTHFYTSPAQHKASQMESST